MKYEVTYGIYSEEINQLICVKYISFGLTHLTVALQKPWMSEYLLWKRQIQCHQEDWPVNGMETDNIFSDQVEVCRPVLIKQFCTVTVAVISDSCDIVGQRIEPYVYDMFWIEVYRDSPFEGCSRYTQILKSRKQEVVWKEDDSVCR